MRLIIERNSDKLPAWTGNYVAAKINQLNLTAENPFVRACLPDLRHWVCTNS